MYGRSPEDMRKMFMKNTYNKARFMYGNSLPPIPDSKLGYYEGFDPGMVESMFKVYVLPSSPLEVVEEFRDEKIKPIIINEIGREFNGMVSDIENLRGIKDYDMMIKTSLSRTVNIKNKYPIERDDHCVYTQIVTTIMDKQFRYYNTLKGRPIYSVLTYVIPDGMKKVKENMLTSKDFIRITKNIETLFQSACVTRSNVLILTPYGVDSEVPQEDVIKVYNFLISKYGHHFTHVIVAVSENLGSDIYKMYKEKIINNQNIEKRVDNQFISEETKIAHKQLSNKNRPKEDQ